MAIEHPFQALFETFGRLPSVHAESVNRLAYQQLWDLLAVSPDQPGRCILLRAPRAGHGKTHLLSRLQHHLGAGHEFIPLHAANGSHIDASTVTVDTISRLSRALPAGAGLTVLDLLVRRLFALALQPLVRSGEVPCQDREGALAALRNRPIETFDFHHPNAVTAHWAKENFEVLGPRLALELAQRSGAPLRDVTFWVEVLFRFVAAPVDHPPRASHLLQAVSGDLPASQVFERLAALLGLFSQLVRIVLVADDLEGFSADESAALKLAAFLGSLRHSAERVDAIVSVNRDIWESAFLPRLSAGLADRLAEVVVELDPLDQTDIIALLDARAPGLGERVFGRLDLTAGTQHARGILRAAADAWTQAAQQARANQNEAAAAEAPAASAIQPTATPVVDSPEDELVEEEPVPVLTPPVDVPAAAYTLVEETPLATLLTPAAENVPVAVLIPDPAYAPPVGEPVAEFSYAPSSTSGPTTQLAGTSWGTAEPGAAYAPVAFTPVIRPETPLAEVLASEAATVPHSHPLPYAQVVPPDSPDPSPFRIPTETVESPAIAPAFVPASEPIFAQPEPAPEVVAPELTSPLASTPPAGFETPPPVPPVQASSAAPETDRVDELLRQFRERYARG